MDRNLRAGLVEDLKRKIVLITGPRQCGKTTLSKMLDDENQYLSYDLVEHRLLIERKLWDRSKRLVIFDELHKMDHWKSWIKGIYDVEGIPPALLVTGSARLEAFRRTGDSLAGRHFTVRLHPIDLKEALAHTDFDAEEIFSRLLTVGGFPEPFLNGRRSYYNRWKRAHIDVVIKEDLLTLTAVRDIQKIETLIEMLRSRVGSPVSVNSLAEDLQKSPNTILHWLGLLEDLYVIFKVPPYHRNIARALLKQSKYYFYDNGMVQGDEGTKFENLVACALLKEIHRLEDVEGENMDLRFIRDKSAREVDFLVLKSHKPIHMIEAKWADSSLSANLTRFLQNQSIQRTQVVAELRTPMSTVTGERIVPGKEFLSELPIAKT
ncbi:MAG: ATP-binding protein [Gammaproteobacteria bacterium]|nr:ATP-binding protein [Gammaproteobacteria bacterium]